MRLDTELRETLNSYAEQAPQGTDLLAGVRARSRRMGHRRVAGGVAIAVLAAAVPAVAFPLVAGTAMHAADRADLPPAEARLAAIDLEMPVFPYEPGWAPPGSGTPRASVGQGRVVLSYPDRHLTVSVGPEPFPLSWAFEAETDSDVNGVPAKLRTGHLGGSATSPWAMLTWPRDGRWITIHGMDPITAADLKRVAEGLRPGEVRPVNKFRLAATPAGWVVSSVWSGTGVSSSSLSDLRFSGSSARPTESSSPVYGLCLAPAWLPDNLYEAALCLNLKDFARLPTAYPLRPVSVNGNEAWIGVDQLTGPHLYIHIGDKLLSIGQGKTHQLSESQLIQFAEGVSIIE